MDKSYIIRIYKQEDEIVQGIVEDVEQNKRFGFGSASELWSLIASISKEQSVSNVIHPTIFNTKRWKMTPSN